MNYMPPADGPSASPTGAAPETGHKILLEHMTRVGREMFNNAQGGREAPANVQRMLQEADRGGY